MTRWTAAVLLPRGQTRGLLHGMKYYAQFCDMIPVVRLPEPPVYCGRSLLSVLTKNVLSGAAIYRVMPTGGFS